MTDPLREHDPWALLEQARTVISRTAPGSEAVRRLIASIDRATADHDVAILDAAPAPAPALDHRDADDPYPHESRQSLIHRIELLTAVLAAEQAAPAPALDRPGVLVDSIEGNLQRVDALRVLELALASQGVPGVNAPSLLRDIEEGGYTLRLTTHDERIRRTDR